MKRIRAYDYNILTRNYQILKIIRYLLVLPHLNENSQFAIFDYVHTYRYVYACARSSVTTRASGPDNVLWYCPWEIQDCQRGISIFDGCTKFQAWPGRLMTSAPSYAEGGNPKCVHPVHQRGMNSTNWWVWSRRRSIDKLHAQSQWPFLLHWPYSFVARFANKLEFFFSHISLWKPWMYVEIHMLLSYYVLFCYKDSSCVIIIIMSQYCAFCIFYIFNLTLYDYMI